MQGTQADVGQVANRGGHHIQCVRRMLLGTGRILRRLQCMGEMGAQGG